MTGKDYRKEYEELKMSEQSLDAHVTSRLVELGERFPDAVIIKKADDEIKAKCLTKNWVDTLSIETRIEYIITIEEWNAETEKVKQLTMI